ncbi:MAG: VOC family protein [Pseudomonadota bacterium]
MTQVITPEVAVSTPIRPTKLAHVVFRTQQLQALIQWYCKLLCAHVVFESDHIAFLTYDDEHHRIALLASDTLSERAQSPAVGFYHIAFTYQDLASLLRNYLRLKADRVLPYRTIVHGPTVSMYYRDPDGNEIELQIDVFPSAEAATAWMRGDAFLGNPIGIEFDPEDLLRRFNAGEAIENLTRRADD